MRVRRGYTIVEIIIVLAIMLVLLVLGVVTLNNAQRSSRDTVMQLVRRASKATATHRPSSF